MAGTHWIVEGNIDPRWPINTRGNIGEVFPEVLTPLSYTLGTLAAEAGWRDAYREIGILRKGDFKSANPVIIGLYAGYGYLNVSYLRMIGVRAPGSSPEAIDATLFGEGNPPPYVPRKGDKSLLSSLKILLTVLKALGTKSQPPIVEQTYKIVADWEAKCPPLDADDEALLAYMQAFPPIFRQVFCNHIITSSIAAVVSGILVDNAKAAGKPELVTHLMGAAGDVLSASYSQELYEIAKLLRGNPAIAAAFDAGTTGLPGRLNSMPEAAEFNEAFAGFIARHGHRGPNDWEISSRTWENTPELALVAIDRIRLAEHDLSPAIRLRDMEARQQAAIAKVLPHVKLLDKGNFKKAVKALPHWTRAREATRDRAVRMGATGKRVFRELVRRTAICCRDAAILHHLAGRGAEHRGDGSSSGSQAQGGLRRRGTEGRWVLLRHRARSRPCRTRSFRRKGASAWRHSGRAADRSGLDAAVPAGRRGGGQCRSAYEPRRHCIA